jgi:hypothetical protein
MGRTDITSNLHENNAQERVNQARKWGIFSEKKKPNSDSSEMANNQLARNPEWERIGRRYSKEQANGLAALTNGSQEMRTKSWQWQCRKPRNAVL